MIAFDSPDETHALQGLVYVVLRAIREDSEEIPLVRRVSQIGLAFLLLAQQIKHERTFPCSARARNYGKTASSKPAVEAVGVKRLQYPLALRWPFDGRMRECQHGFCRFQFADVH